MSAFTFEESNRIFLGKLDLSLLTTAPVGVPAAGPGVIENVYNINIIHIE